MEKENDKLIIILGPTASGKSDLAVKIAKKFNGEVISADSRQVYRGMDIGSGKITHGEMRGIPHYLLDVASPRQRFTAARFKKIGQKAIKEIQAKNKLPIICGGTGFYIQTLVDNLALPEVKPNLKLRAKLEKKSTEELFEILQKLDPRRAQNIDAKNPRRLIRAIEIVKSTGKPVSSLTSPVIPAQAGIQTQKSNPDPRFREDDTNALFLGISKSPADLQKLIHRRLLARLDQGMIEEIKKLHSDGVSWKRLEEFGLEYRWIALFLQNKISRDEMISRLQKDIEHFAKRQMTWFKRDVRIHWIKNYKEAEKLARKYLK
ncbi:MAG: tRNA dimethylallyltransferase [Parcubacteria group bacterium GW2011_GWC1_43_12]|nr:MAG: tRNA dimethylallyltransferase [Parcubacteria group bacterium GW2011_GWB1_42_6]KKS92080.1 MAG: tRNA dimethylallyltransferase [Parcubacteria group bacterium GW2011_GWC1_43_12]